MSLQIPMIASPAFTQEITLEEITYKFKFTWNTRGEFWLLNVLDIEENAIVSGIKIVLNYELFHMFKHLKIPKGQLYAIDPSDDTTKIAFDDFTNKRGLTLVYFTEAEIESNS